MSPAWVPPPPHLRWHSASHIPTRCGTPPAYSFGSSAPQAPARPGCPRPPQMQCQTRSGRLPALLAHACSQLAAWRHCIISRLSVPEYATCAPWWVTGAITVPAGQLLHVGALAAAPLSHGPPCPPPHTHTLMTQAHADSPSHPPTTPTPTPWPTLISPPLSSNHPPVEVLLLCQLSCCSCGVAAHLPFLQLPPLARPLAAALLPSQVGPARAQPCSTTRTPRSEPGCARLCTLMQAATVAQRHPCSDDCLSMHTHDRQEYACNPLCLPAPGHGCLPSQHCPHPHPESCNTRQVHQCAPLPTAPQPRTAAPPTSCAAACCCSVLLLLPPAPATCTRLLSRLWVRVRGRAGRHCLAALLLLLLVVWWAVLLLQPCKLCLLCCQTFLQGGGTRGAGPPAGSKADIREAEAEQSAQHSKEL
jgi:hypothetical protein